MKTQQGKQVNKTREISIEHCDRLLCPICETDRIELEDATVIRRFNKIRFPPKGVAGGRDGSRARFVVRLGTPEEYETPASARVEMRAGERFLLQSAGGGGCGDPAKRNPAAVARDVAEGSVTAEAAKDYGG